MKDFDTSNTENCFETSTTVIDEDFSSTTKTARITNDCSGSLFKLWFYRKLYCFLYFSFFLSFL